MREPLRAAGGVFDFRLHFAPPRVKLSVPAAMEAIAPLVSRHRSRRIIGVVSPLVLTAIATSVLLLSADFYDPSTVFRAALGVALLVAVFVRQASQIVDLERQVTHRENQLSVMSEVVSALSSSPHTGSTLSLALERIIAGLSADAAAIWLPSAADGGKLGLAEQIGLPDAGRASEILDMLREHFPSGERTLSHHSSPIPGQAEDQASAQCLTVKMGRRAEDYGYLTVIRWDGAFDQAGASMLSAIGSNIAGTVRSIRLIAEAQNLADRDPVTSLYNHRYAYQRLYSEAERHARTGKPMSVLMLDLDNFKLFNDTYGHPAGDEVLTRVAAVLRECFRDSDVVARYGGDEFMVILTETTLEQAVMCARRLQNRLASEHFSPDGSNSAPIYMSCGVANHPRDTTEVLELIAIADGNLYTAKTQGKGLITARTSDVMDNTLLQVEGVDLLRSLVIAVDNKDRYTRRHSEEVTTYSLEIAQAMDVGEEMLRAIHIAGLLHDVGKICVPDRILRKPGKLTADEVAVMNKHPVVGALIVGSLPGMEEVVKGVRYHHERYGGGGYPDGLEGTDIPLIARILAVSDVFSALTTHRPYRKALSRAEAVREIERNLGTQFDAEIGRLFICLQRARLKESRTTEETDMAPQGARPAEAV